MISYTEKKKSLLIRKVILLLIAKLLIFNLRNVSVRIDCIYY